MRIVAISDTHGKHGKIEVPDGDVLLHAGDLSRRGKLPELEDFATFLRSLPHQHKVVIAGNHDFGLEQAPEEARALLADCCTYLQDTSVTIEGVKIYGSPWQPEFFQWAFNLKRGAPLREKWEKIPEDVDILITHGPPAGILDIVANGDHVGCEELLEMVQKRKPKYHIFGHIHEAHGVRKVGETTFVNASICTLRYQPINPAYVFDWDGVHSLG